MNGRSNEGCNGRPRDTRHSHDSVITQIAACYFDRYTGEIGDEFEFNIDIDSCLAAGLTITAGSIEFWMEREGTWLKDPVSLKNALDNFSIFMNRYKGALMWSHATFDAVIIANAYHAIGQGIPYSFRNVRDIRTLVDLAKVEYNKEEGVDEKTHDALEDCKYQVEYCVECFKELQHID